jgi:hypothetical protein
VEAELKLTTEKIHTQEQQLEFLTNYSASYDRDKAELAGYRSKRGAMVANSMQTEIPVAHQSVQTDFFAPPVSPSLCPPLVSSVSLSRPPSCATLDDPSTHSPPSLSSKSPPVPVSPSHCPFVSKYRHVSHLLNCLLSTLHGLSHRHATIRPDLTLCDLCLRLHSGSPWRIRSLLRWLRSSLPKKQHCGGRHSNDSGLQRRDGGRPGRWQRGLLCLEFS